MCHFQVQNGPFVMNKFFLVQTIITFIYLLALFIVQNLKTFLQQIQSYEGVSFFGPKWSFAPPQLFFGKLLISFSSTNQPLLLCKIFKKHSSSRSRVMMCNFLAQNGPFPQMRIFFRKPVDEPCFFHSCLSIYMPKIKVRYYSISEIIGPEPLLAKT